MRHWAKKKTHRADQGITLVMAIGSEFFVRATAICVRMESAEEIKWEKDTTKYFLKNI